jgi:N-acetylmuramoyl-L-alanine amidase
VSEHRRNRRLVLLLGLAGLAVVLAVAGSRHRAGADAVRPPQRAALRSPPGAAGPPAVPQASVPAPAARSATTPAASAPGGLSGRVITIDPGHNGGNFTNSQQISRLVPDGNGQKECDTTGTAAPDGYREADFNWSVAQRLQALLRAAGARVVMTRSSNAGVGPCVNERAAIGNRAHSDAAISIHADGGPPGGSGFAILTPAAIPGGGDRGIIAPSGRLAVQLRGALIGIGLHTSTYDGHGGIVPRTDLGGLNLSRVPKVFVEVANMQNRADEAPMESAAYRQRVARALLSGLERFLRAG